MNKSKTIFGFLMMTSFILGGLFVGGISPANANQQGSLTEHEINFQATPTVGLVELGNNTYGPTPNNLRNIVENVIKFILALLGIVLLIMVIYAGIMWMSSGGNPEKIGKAKKLLTSSIIGLALILAAYAISQFVVINLDNIIKSGGSTSPKQ